MHCPCLADCLVSLHVWLLCVQKQSPGCCTRRDCGTIPFLHTSGGPLCLPAGLPACVSGCSVCLSAVCLSAVCLSGCLSLFVCLSLSVCLFLCLRLSVCFCWPPGSLAGRTQRTEQAAQSQPLAARNLQSIAVMNNEMAVAGPTCSSCPTRRAGPPGGARTEWLGGMVERPSAGAVWVRLPSAPRHW